MNFNPTRYSICNIATGDMFPDKGWTLEDASHPLSLIRAIYEKNQIEDKENLKRSWMDYENFKKHENNLIDYIKTLTVNDLKEIYKVGKNTKTLRSEERRVGKEGVRTCRYRMWR